MSDFLRSINAWGPTQYERRTKTCPICDTQFCDVTKRNIGQCCSQKCANERMVATRMKNGTYKRTKEQNAKMVATIRDRKASGEIKPIDREKLRASIRRSIDEGRHRFSRGDKHWTKQPGAAEKLSKLNKGRKFSVKTRLRMSVSASKRVRTKRETLYTSARGGVRPDLGMYFRSRWEANFARLLNLEGAAWEYEPVSFDLPSGGTYTPDFRVGTRYYELKGRMTEKCQHKIDTFRALGHELVVIGPTEYDELRKRKSEIPLWEGR